MSTTMTVATTTTTTTTTTSALPLTMWLVVGGAVGIEGHALNEDDDADVDDNDDADVVCRR